MFEPSTAAGTTCISALSHRYSRWPATSNFSGFDSYSIWSVDKPGHENTKIGSIAQGTEKPSATRINKIQPIAVCDGACIKLLIDGRSHWEQFSKFHPK
jgi:hypothetical protein